MARKIKSLKQEAAKALEKFKESERLLAEAEEEEHKTVERVEQTINALISDHGLFCGVILTHSDLVSILDIALKTGENVKIPFKLYFND
jgi:hypothetical protein